MIHARIFVLSFLFFPFSENIFGQVTINLKNPSFEDNPRMGGLPSLDINGWSDCGLFRFPGASPPDILPTANHDWGVDMEAMDGKTYLNLVVREDDSWEYVSQKLKTSLDPAKCYSLE